jgi:hypothetical protein
MKVVYVPNDKTINDLTPGKIYDVIKSFDFSYGLSMYYIIDDNDLNCWYTDEVLTPLDKYREDKLNEIGI